MIDGQEDSYLNWFYDWTYKQSAITSEAREEYIKQYSNPGAMHASFEYYRAVFEDAQQNKEYAIIDYRWGSRCRQVNYNFISKSCE